MTTMSLIDGAGSMVEVPLFAGGRKKSKQVPWWMSAGGMKHCPSAQVMSQAVTKNGAFSPVVDRKILHTSVEKYRCERAQDGDCHREKHLRCSRSTSKRPLHPFLPIFGWNTVFVSRSASLRQLA